VLIVGAGMVGVTLAYFLTKLGSFDVTIIDKDISVKGASRQNANTITLIPFPAWTTINIWAVLKQNVLRDANPSSYFRFSLLLESQFRLWLFRYMRSRSASVVERSNLAIVKMGAFGFRLFDDYVADVTGAQPDLVDYHDEVVTTVLKGLTADEVASKDKVYAFLAQYDPYCHKASPEDTAKFVGASAMYRLKLKLLNTLKFCELARNKIVADLGVKFVQGEVNEVTHSARSVRAVGYRDAAGGQHSLGGFGKYVFCGGIESINLGRLVGTKVPIYGFKGHSLNVYVDQTSMPDSSYIVVPDNVAIARVGLNTSGMVRVTGYSDVVGNNLDTLPLRKQQLVAFTKKFIGEQHYDDSKADHWVGLRPVSADDVPIVGQSTKFDNLYWNTGHGSRGITHAPASAVLLTSIMAGTDAPKELEASDYSPARFGM